MIGTDEAIDFATDQAWTIAQKASECAEYAAANDWSDFFENGRDCLEEVSKEIEETLDEVTEEFFKGKWMKERGLDAFMHLIEFQLDNNLDDDDAT